MEELKVDELNDKLNKLRDWLTEDEVKEYLIHFKAKTENGILNFKSPNKDDIFNAFNGLTPANIKVLIIGQDPYPEPDKAQGLSFSHKKWEIVDASLLNIFKAIKTYQYKENGVDKTFYDITPTEVAWNTDLKEWSEKNKVLFLNTALTYESKDNPHFRYWKNFIDIIVKKILEQDSKLVIIAWGNKARDCVFRNTKLIKDKKNKKKDIKVQIDKNKEMLYCYHPSPTNNINSKKIEASNFLFANVASGHFKECDKFLFGNDESKYIWKNFPENN